MIKGILIGIGAIAAATLFIADQIGGAIASLVEDTQEWPACNNCIGSVDDSICQYCNDGSCWEHKNESMYRNPTAKT